MAADRLKFRCYQCTQLLAVSPSKAGSVVACPKCKAELLIPKTGSASSPSWASAETGPFPQIITESSSMQPSAPVVGHDPDSFIPPEVANLRPEDLRIEAAAFDGVSTVPRVETGSTGESRSSGIFLNVQIPTATSAVETIDSMFSRSPSFTPPPMPDPSPVSPSADAATARIPNLTAPRALATVETGSPSISAIPAIDVEPPTLTRPNADRRTVREVSLPATVVLAWSLFVIFALGMAFVAGLLIGHFVWKLPV